MLVARAVKHLLVRLSQPISILINEFEKHSESEVQKDTK